MKTEKEILKKLKEVESIDNKILIDAKECTNIILKWALETTPPKRTIFELNEPELKELVIIARLTPQHIAGTMELEIKKLTDRVLIKIYGKNIIANVLEIKENLDFYSYIYESEITCCSKGLRTNNQVKLRECLNEMLRR